MKLSDIVDIEPIAEEYQFEIAALRAVRVARTKDTSALDLEVLVDGNRLLHGAFNEPVDLDGYHSLSLKILDLVEAYLTGTVERTTKELADRGVAVDI